VRDLQRTRGEICLNRIWDWGGKKKKPGREKGGKSISLGIRVHVLPEKKRRKTELCSGFAMGASRRADKGSRGKQLQILPKYGVPKRNLEPGAAASQNAGP